MSLPTLALTTGTGSAAQTPSLPQTASADERASRQLQLSLARTSYNYMRTYLEPVPMSADLPKGEEFSLAYEAQVLQAFVPIAENFKRVILRLLTEELQGDLPTATLEKIKQSFDKLDRELSILHPERDLADLKALLDSLAQLPEALRGIVRLPKDIETMATGLEKSFNGLMQEGPTAFLKATLFDMLSADHGRAYLQADAVADYNELFMDLPLPQALTLERQEWMTQSGLPCEQDWYFGNLQTAGFNTTNLKGVVLSQASGGMAVIWPDLLKKMPITDTIFQAVLGDPTATLLDAINQRRLYVCDYAQFESAESDIFHGEPRYLVAPIALFYWNPKPPAGYPPGGPGVMQPIAIQLAQKYDAETAPIFTPNDGAQAGDANGLKWKIAKYTVNVVCAIQHESVAHLGACHMTVEPIVVATHRQLAEQHPLFKLLLPHFRFTININDSAIHSLIIPGGVVASTVCPTISSTLAMLVQAHQAWRWDDNLPERLFALRGVDKLPSFAFRDDTLLLWEAIQRFVGGYLKVYYASDAAVLADSELQGWVNELASPMYVGFKGLGGLKPNANPQRPWQLDSLDYLIKMVSHIIYIAGPQHAAVNYAQYPLMTYMPSVSGCIYSPPPSKSSVLASATDCLKWYPPLDVSLYTLSFEYLLSAIQFDTFGHYEDNPRTPYFTDPRVAPLVADLHDDLALAEIEIRKRNRSRPMAYEFQLPSRIPNSISI